MLKYIATLYLFTILFISCNKETNNIVDVITKDTTPTEFDWRDKGIITPPKNQGNLGSCGVFAGTGVFEALIKKETGKTVDLSEQHIINCSADWHGAMSSISALKFMTNNGVVEENILPYEAKKTNDKPDHEFDYKLAEYLYVDVAGMELDERVNLFKEKILEYGPVATAMDFYIDLRKYTSGVYIYDGVSPLSYGHWVIITGWKDDPNIKNGGYWIVKNSSGPNWGNNGYFYTPYGEVNIDAYVFCYGIFDVK